MWLARPSGWNGFVSTASVSCCGAPRTSTARGRPGRRRLCRDELLGDEVHAIAQRRDERDVGESVELGEHTVIVRAIQVADPAPSRPRRTGR